MNNQNQDYQSGYPNGNQQNYQPDYQQGYQGNYQQNYQQDYQQNYQQGYQDNYQQSQQPDYQSDYYQRYYQPNSYLGNQSPYTQQPMRRLKTNRSLWKYLLLGLVTFGIYDYIVMFYVSEDINEIASRYDGKKTMNFLLMYLVIAPITLGIGGIVWFHNLSKRIGDELQRRNINYKFNTGTFWLLYVLLPVLSFIFMFVYTFVFGNTGSEPSGLMMTGMYLLIILTTIGPYVYLHKLFKAMNLLSASYNMYG